jgi:hypothetical protein
MELMLDVTELQACVDPQAGAVRTSDGLHSVLGVPDHWLVAHCLCRRTGSTNASLLPLLISSFPNVRVGGKTEIHPSSLNIQKPNS